LQEETAQRIAESDEDKFIILSEFQVWADVAGPEVYEKLNKLYIERNNSHVWRLYPHYENYVWELDKTKAWIDEAAELGCFNVFCIGDDTRTAGGYLLTREGVNPVYKDFFFECIRYAHEKGFMVAIEPLRMPRIKDRAHLEPWLKSWLGPDIPKSDRADIIKLSLEWFGAFRNNPSMAEEAEDFLVNCREICPDVFIYIDSISGKWRRPQPFHRWLLHRFPGTIISHYLNTDQIDPFREAGARNMMVQVNPCELFGPAGQYFIYHQETVTFLKNICDKRVRYISLAGVNMGYCRRNFDLFLDILRPHLNLVKDIPELRRTVTPDEIVDPPTKEQVKAQMTAENEERARRRAAEEAKKKEKAKKP
jgi:hypothetical protein